MIKHRQEYYKEVFGLQKLLHVNLISAGCSQRNALDIVTNNFVYGTVTTYLIDDKTDQVDKIKRLSENILELRKIISEYICPEDDRVFFIQQLINMLKDNGTV